MPLIPIPPPHEPFIDPETGLVRELWYRYLNQNQSAVNGIEYNVDTTNSLTGHIIDFGDTDGATLELRNHSDAFQGPFLEFYQDSDSPQAGDAVGKIQWWGNTSSGTVGFYGTHMIVITDPTVSGTYSRQEFYVVNNGATVMPVRMDGDGVKFFGDTAAANALDDYEEGTWTPTLTTSGVDFTSVTYNGFTRGNYTKIGNTVNFWGQLMTDSVTVGGATLNVRIGGLPFTANSNINQGVVVSFVQNWAGEQPNAATINANSTTIDLYYRTAVDGATLNTAVADVGTTASDNQIIFAGTYFV